MVLSDVKETVTSVEVDEETCEEMIKVIFFSCAAPLLRCNCFICSILTFALLIFPQSTTREIPMLYVRGDGVILVAPPMRG